MYFVFWGAAFLIIYSYVVFPLLLAAVVRGRGKEGVPSSLVNASDPDAWPRVAMVVAAFNEERVLESKLANTWAIDYPRDKFQLVIGSDGSGDKTAEILRVCSDSRLHTHLFDQRRGKISVLNDVIEQTDADIIVMSDANTLFVPNAVKDMVRHFHNPQVGCVSGEIVLEQNGGASGEGLYWRYENWIKHNESRLGFLLGCNGGIFAFPKALHEPLPAGVIVEDFVMTMRILERGYQVRLEPKARGVEPPCPSSRAEMVRKIRIGAGNFQALGFTYRLLSPRYGLRAFAFWSHKVLRWLVPLFLLALLGANSALLHHSVYQVLLGLQAGGVLVALWSYNRRPGSTIPSWTKPISYFYLMNYALFCGLLRFVFGTQRVTWERAAR